MSDEFDKELLKDEVAGILKNAGWNRMTIEAMDVITYAVETYIFNVVNTASRSSMTSTQTFLRKNDIVRTLLGMDADINQLRCFWKQATRALKDIDFPTAVAPEVEVPLVNPTPENVVPVPVNEDQTLQKGKNIPIFTTSKDQTRRGQKFKKRISIYNKRDIKRRFLSQFYQKEEQKLNDDFVFQIPTARAPKAKKLRSPRKSTDLSTVRVLHPGQAVKMADEYVKNALTSSVAQTCKRMGFQSITPSALETLVELVSYNISVIISTATKFPASSNQTELCLEHIQQALGDLGISCIELMDYVKETKDPYISAPIPVPTNTNGSRVNPETGTVVEGFVEVHQWLDQCKDHFEDNLEFSGKEIGVGQLVERCPNCMDLEDEPSEQSERTRPTCSSSSSMNKCKFTIFTEQYGQESDETSEADNEKTEEE